MQATDDPETKSTIEDLLSKTADASWYHAMGAASSRQLQGVLDPTSPSIEPKHQADKEEGPLGMFTKFKNLVLQVHKDKAAISNGSNDGGMHSQGTIGQSQDWTKARLALAERMIAEQHGDLTVEYVEIGGDPQLYLLLMSTGRRNF